MNAQETPVFVYFIGTDALVKIGIASYPEKRLQELQIASPEKLYLLATVQCCDRDRAVKLEGAFHKWYAEAALRGEWFRINQFRLVEDLEFLRQLANGIICVRRQMIFPQSETIAPNGSRVMKLDVPANIKPRRISSEGDV